jgi:hypothetical protein
MTMTVGGGWLLAFMRFLLEWFLPFPLIGRQLDFQKLPVGDCADRRFR